MSVPITKNPSLKLVEFKGKSKKVQEIQQLINDIIIVLNDSYTNINELKNDVSLVKTICQLVVNHDCKTITNDDYENIIISVITRLFPDKSNPDELDKLKASIQFVFEECKIKRIGTISKSLYSVKSWILKKL